MLLVNNFYVGGGWAWDRCNKDSMLLSFMESVSGSENEVLQTLVLPLCNTNVALLQGFDVGAWESSYCVLT